MLKLLQSKWTAVLVAAAAFFATLILMWPSKLLAPPPAAPKSRLQAFDFNNIKDNELDLLIAALKASRVELEQREQKLQQWELRLQVERQELLRLSEQIQQKCLERDRLANQKQAEFSQFVTRVESNEVANTQRLANTYSQMEPGAAAAILLQMPDDKLLKLVTYIDQGAMAAILAAIAKTDPKRAAELTERMRLVLTPPTNAAPVTASAP